MIKAEVAKDEAGLRMVQGWYKPGPAATVLLCPGPGTLQLTVRLGVVIKKLRVTLIRKIAFSEFFRDSFEGILCIE